MPYHAEPDNEGVVKKDSWDRRQYKALRDQSQVLREGERRLGEKIPGPLVEDTWAALFKAKPELLPATPGLTVLRHVMEQLMATPEYQEIRQWTKLDEWASALGAAHLAKKVEEWANQNSDALNGLSGGGLSAAGLAGESGQPPSGSQGSAGAPPASGRTNPGGSSSQGNQTETGDGGQTAAEAAIRALREKLRGGLQELSDVGGLLWGTGPGHPHRLDSRRTEQVANLLQRNQKFLRVARMAGRMYTASLVRRMQRGRDGIIRAGITLGADLSKVLPEELVALRHPVLRRDFLQRFAEGQLRQMDVRGAEQKRGPVVCCVDGSGSMAGKKIEWAKAVALALYRIARKERRGFTGIVFSDGVAGVYKLLPTVEGESGGSLEEFVELFPDGGTNFQDPLNEAVRTIKHQRRADIVFITDGMAPVSEAWERDFRKRRQHLGVRVFGIYIPEPGQDSDRGLETLKRISDMVMQVQPDPEGKGLEVVLDSV